MQHKGLRFWGARSWAALAALLQATLPVFVAVPAVAEQIRYVPQLGLTDLAPRKILFRPGDPQTLMVVNWTGRIDLFDVSNQDHPIKMPEIRANAHDAAFNPAGDRIVSGGNRNDAMRFMADLPERLETYRAEIGRPSLSLALSRP